MTVQGFFHQYANYFEEGKETFEYISVNSPQDFKQIQGIAKMQNKVRKCIRHDNQCHA